MMRAALFMTKVLRKEPLTESDWVDCAHIVCSALIWMRDNTHIKSSEELKSSQKQQKHRND